MTKVLLVYGTRPEAVKMAPLLPALRALGITPIIAVTGQHREMLDQVNELFEIKPHYDLGLGRPRQSLAHIASSAVQAVNDIVRKVRPEAVVVQGDTSTTFAAALASFYEQRPVVHLEAGLRTGNRYSPFPEEVNRRLTTQIASLHLAPTSLNRAHLLAEGVADDSIVVTGNTVIDALLEISSRKLPYTEPGLAELANSGRRMVLITTHRRESWGDRMASAMKAVRSLATRHADVAFVLPMHKNPIVREVVEPLLIDLPNVLLIEPLDYAQFARLLSESYLVLTDSGGVQEEAPSLGKPVLVMREDTERPEAVSSGSARLVGTDAERIFSEASVLLEDQIHYSKMAQARNPFGDGEAGQRCAAAVAALLGVGCRLSDFAAS